MDVFVKYFKNLSANKHGTFEILSSFSWVTTFTCPRTTTATCTSSWRRPQSRGPFTGLSGQEEAPLTATPASQTRLDLLHSNLLHSNEPASIPATRTLAPSPALTPRWDCREAWWKALLQSVRANQRANRSCESLRTLCNELQRARTSLRTVKPRVSRSHPMRDQNDGRMARVILITRWSSCDLTTEGTVSTSDCRNVDK